MKVAPFFSIGLTTYDRVDLLRQSVSSILDQTLADFELIIGNDNPARTLTPDDIGTRDGRIRIINQPRNLGQVGNWRSLLEYAGGRYFTWIADDDLYAPDFLAACHATLAAHEFPRCAFTSFETIAGQDTAVISPAYSGHSSLSSGLELLWGYLLDEVQLLGNMGVFDREFLLNHAPWAKMEHPGVALFREYLFVVLAAKLDKVAYVPDRLILYRDHAGSWGSSNAEIEDYRAAGQWLVGQCAAMLKGDVDPAAQEQLEMLVFKVALKQIASKRKNASFPIDVEALFDALLGLPESSATKPHEPDSPRPARSRERRIFLSLCREFAAAEIGRIAKEAEISRIAEEARRRAVAIEHLTADNVERLRISEERRLHIEQLNLELMARDQNIAKHGTEFAYARSVIARKDSALTERQAALADKDRALADAQAALAQRDRALDDARAALALAAQALGGDGATTARPPEAQTDAASMIEPAPAGTSVMEIELQEKEQVIEELSRMETELEEKEQVIEELSRALKAFRTAHFVLSPRETCARYVSQLRAVVAPRLGNLNQHAPVPLRRIVPYRSRTPSDRLPAISVVIPTYQQGSFIERTMRSLLDQAYPKTECVIQDGGSTDGTVAVLERYGSQLAFWESRPDGGQSHALNLGLARTTGEIMGWLNSDDLLLPGALACVGDYFACHPDVDVVYGNRLLIDETDMEIGRWILPGHDGEVLGWADYVPQETLYFRRSIWAKVGGKIDESFQFAMDWDLLIRFRDAGARFAHIPRFLGAFRIHGLQKTSAAIGDVGHREMDRIRERIHGHVPGYDEIGKAIRPFLKRHVAIDLAGRVKSRLTGSR